MSLQENGNTQKVVPETFSYYHKYFFSLIQKHAWDFTWFLSYKRKNKSSSFFFYYLPHNGRRLNPFNFYKGLLILNFLRNSLLVVIISVLVNSPWYLEARTCMNWRMQLNELKQIKSIVCYATSGKRLSFEEKGRHL